jgi:hypothetical protein
VVKHIDCDYRVEGVVLEENRGPVRLTLDSTGASNAAVLTSVRTGSGRLKLITWDDGAGIT